MFRTLLSRWVDHRSQYQLDLERYVSSRYPKNTYDVELFIKEFEEKLSKGKYHEIIR